MKVGILLVSTRKYKIFVQPLIDSIKMHFLRPHDIVIHLFTDDVDVEYKGGPGVNIVKHSIPSYKFPQATLYRYKIFDDHSEHFKDLEYLFYSDVDMRLEDSVGLEICKPAALTAVRHPGFYISEGWGSQNCSEKSLAYLGPEHRKKYYAGGFQGGHRETYLEACNILRNRIDEDDKIGVIAEHNDETHWNYLLNHPDMNQGLTINELEPSYCMVQQRVTRKAWGIDNLPAKIIALDKQHEKMRE